MAVYVDSEHIEWQGNTWCHLVADSAQELHAFARRLGLRRAWFQSESHYPHYDVTTSMQERALALGAVLADRHTIVSCGRKLRAELLEQRQSEQLVLALAAP